MDRGEIPIEPGDSWFSSKIALGLASYESNAGRALNFLGGVKAYRRISNSEWHIDGVRESDGTR